MHIDCEYLQLEFQPREGLGSSIKVSSGVGLGNAMHSDFDSQGDEFIVGGLDNIHPPLYGIIQGPILDIPSPYFMLWNNARRPSFFHGQMGLCRLQSQLLSLF